MRLHFSILFTLLLLSSAGYADISRQLKCVSNDNVSGWIGTETDKPLVFQALIVANDKIIDAAVSGAYESDSRDLLADLNFKPKSEYFRNYNLFGILEDAWFWFRPVLPKNLLDQDKKFAGYIRIWSEEGYGGQVTLTCQLADAVNQ